MPFFIFKKKHCSSAYKFRINNCTQGQQKTLSGSKDSEWPGTVDVFKANELSQLFPGLTESQEISHYLIYYKHNNAFCHLNLQAYLLEYKSFFIKNTVAVLFFRTFLPSKYKTSAISKITEA